MFSGKLSLYTTTAAAWSRGQRHTGVNNLPIVFALWPWALEMGGIGASIPPLLNLGDNPPPRSRLNCV